MKFRIEFSQRPKCIVVKIGSTGISNEKGGVNKKSLKKLVKDIANLKMNGIDVILVSSGAISCGKPYMKLRDNEVSLSQAFASIGQPILMYEYFKAFTKEGLVPSQHLLTHEDLRSKKRAINTRNCLFRLLDSDIVPIINENDSVSYDEISMGDNDQLAVMIADVIGADTLILLTEADGVYESNPNSKESFPVAYVPYGKKLKVKEFGKTKPGRGGIKMKIAAAEKLSRLGKSVIISTFHSKYPIVDSLLKSQGTFFAPNEKKVENRRKAWITTLVKNDAKIIIDSGAFKAIAKNGSLLPVGVIKVSGKFSRGDSVKIYCNRECIGQGLVEYSSEEVKLIAGKKSGDLSKIIKHPPSKLVIHRDNLYIGK